MTSPPTRDANLVSLLWAGPEMAGEIAGLHATLFNPAWDEASVARLLEHPGSTTLIARVGHPKISIGFAMAQIAVDEGEVLTIGVAKDWQRIGLGSRLIDGILRAMGRAQVKRLFLEVAADDPPAIAFYRKAGFDEVARRPGYYQRPAAPAVDAVVMSKAI